MNAKSLLPMIAATLVAGAAGAAAGFWARNDAPARAHDARRVSRLETQIADLREELQRVRRTPPAAAEQEPGDASPAGVPPTPPTTNEADDQPEFERLRRKVFGWTASAEESARFWELARTSDLLPKLIDRLKAAVGEEPDNVEARLHLARAYVAKLYTVPDGPERGAWAARAEEQWRGVLERDDASWEARFSLAFSLSQWPAFFDKTPEAIREFETLVVQQEAGRPEPRQAQVYLQLARLYRDRGQADKAAATLKRGMERHPENAALRAARDAD